MTDLINHPPHYSSHPSGVECIQITEHMGFNLGNALKYIWRSDLKGYALDDLRKAIWYIEREIAKREVNLSNQTASTKKEPTAFTHPNDVLSGGVDVDGTGPSVITTPPVRRQSH